MNQDVFDPVLSEPGGFRMLTSPRLLTRAIILATALISSTALAAGPGAGAVGTAAADFNLQVFGGGTHSLSQDSGKVVLLFIVGYG
jgi:hypothetical protein